VTASLLAVLEEAKERGFLGPGPVADHVDHAAAFVAALADETPSRWLDLGSGGGLPGLALAEAWAGSAFVLLDAQLRRARFLASALERLGLSERGGVEHARAEDAGRAAGLRGSFDAVVARSFGRPAVTAECGAPFLRRGGVLLVAEPPDAPDRRWKADGLARLGLADHGPISSGEATVRRLVAAEPCPPEFPRRAGVPERKPLFV
jgi:16S rRNA (guanine527-N7)-methyltransferase